MIFEALRFPRVGSSDSARGWGAGIEENTRGVIVLEEEAAIPPAFVPL